jgi:hypothetical protein
MIKLLQAVFVTSLLKLLGVFETIFFIAAVLQSIFTFLLIFTPFLDSYMHSAGSSTGIKLFAIAISYLFFLISTLISLLYDNVKAHFYYIR